ncbi:MAG: protein kinase [Selenomonadaceae bacterium]|nr:protein kinase [Selenomonadaceae bacterium]
MKLPKYLRENFRLLKLIHRSDKTKIWLVDEISSSRKFLLKVINRTGLLYPQISGIKNAALPEIYHVEENGSETFVVEEFLPGMDLQTYLEFRGSLDEQTAARLAIEICDGLAELHHWHIIHRDIKPSNLFLTDAGEFKLIDFDAARLEKPGRFADTYMIGTPGFAAPEQYGFHQTDERTDIYSLGLTLKLLLGYENYRGFLSPVLAKCIEFDPNKRFDSAQSLKRAIIRRQHFRHWKKFAVAACIGVVSLSEIFLFPNVAQDVPPPAPATKLPTAEPKVAPVEKIPSAEETSHVEENIPEQLPAENFVDEEIPAPSSPEEPIYYDQPAKVEPTKPKREIDFSAADSTTVRELGMPRKILEERDANADDYYKRMELNARQKEFEQSLPDDMTDDEKHEATMEFRRRTKDAIGLK